MSTLYFFLKDDTNEYIGTGESTFDKEGVEIIPPEATLIAPPSFTSGHQIPVFDINTQMWSLVNDFRGKSYLNTSTNEIEYITEIDTDLPVSAAPQLDLNKKIAKQSVYEKMQKYANIDVIEVAGVNHRVNRYTMDFIEASRPNGVWNLLPKESGDDIAYVDADNNTRTLSRGQAVAVSNAFAVRNATNYVNLKTIIQNIDNATSQAALDAVDTDIGWVQN